jgi:hypothetical protein
LAFSAPPPSSSRRRNAAAGMEERRLLSKRRSHVAWRPKLPGQIEFSPTHTGPAAHGGIIPSGTDMKHAAEQRHRHGPRSRCSLPTG